MQASHTFGKKSKCHRGISNEFNNLKKSLDSQLWFAEWSLNEHQNMNDNVEHI